MTPDIGKSFTGSIPQVYESHLVPMIFAPYAADLVDRLRRHPVSGVLEISVKDVALLDETLLSRIDAAIPILGQLMHQSQTEFTAGITNMIRTNFTAIQPSVLWKFNEVAWEYIKNSGRN